MEVLRDDESLEVDERFCGKAERVICFEEDP